MKDTLVVNLIGGSGCGKSTNASRLFVWLKDKGIECEVAEEWVKKSVWEGRTSIFNCQPYIFGKELWKIQREIGKVDVIITDRPICLDMVYDPDQDENFKKYSLKKFNEFNNLNILLNRVKPFSSNGRNEKNIEEAIAIDNKIKKMLDDNNIEYTIVNGDEEGCRQVLKMILDRLNNKEGE